ncbi:MAG: methionine--tRNA ligase [Acidimicrobiaceae bacterium]|nr:methionine--tRNA ligase [Acidimicrobiaceae bacterium]MXW76069.1 methionine--tRNA ligase [Acidimicrobiaceae bacterium]MYA75033.1 methionine--tRNA ligase [Acidimicrobiaceae bacterium]MYC43242.1 methionine--tRNA ligase [Acidimicrobiaceae bacterium]MYD06210.1 methionine--tRNA ligase [Acidimicrobiaceae bacterium]
MSVPVLVAVAWPYASGSRHLGHLAGAYLPADVFARQQRIVGNEVLMVSGSDVHGTPITVRADAEGVTPSVIVDRYHNEFVRQWEELGFSWDLFTTTGTENHARVTQEMFLAQLQNGHIDRRVSEQYYDATADRFLPDRYIEGTCPHCGYTEARGDQCDDCGQTLDALDLGDPRSKISGAVPERRETEHFYFRYSDFTEQLAEIYKDKSHWRPHVLNFVLGYIREGLLDRAITRDIEWGIELPVDDLGPGKRIYVWYDAVIGYLSASKEWSAQQGDDEAWRHWWENDDSRHVYFIGKDNIPFHCLFWPAQLIGAGNLHLPDDVPANQYVTFKGGKASASRGVGLTIDEGLALFEPDGLRYALAANFPEQADTEVSIESIARRINEELVATWGNLVNRVLSMLHNNHGVQPPSEDRTAEDQALLDTVEETLAVCGQLFERVELRGALRTAMAGAQAINTYLNATEPWKLAKSDAQRSATVLATALDAINCIRVGLAPFLPFSSARLDEILGPLDGWSTRPVPPGTEIPKPTPLFTKVDIDAIQVS